MPLRSAWIGLERAANCKLPATVRKALGLRTGMRVNVKVEGKSAKLTPAPAKKTSPIEEIAALLNYTGPAVPVTVVLELEWVLRSRYAFTQSVIAQTMEKIAALENMVIGERDAVLSAAAKLAHGWDFADALHHALSQGCDDFVTLDADLAKRSRRVSGVAPAVFRL